MMNGKREKPVKKVFAVFAMAIAVMIFDSLTHAQQAVKVYRIGFLAGTSPSALAPRSNAFRRGMRELGYVEGKNVVIEDRYAEGKFSRLPDLAADLVRSRIDIIVSAGPAVTRRIKEVAGKIPIVMAFDNDPVGSGFVASLARPGGNITGLSSLAPELNAKQIELAKEILPQASRLAVIGDSTEAGNAQSLKALEHAAKGLGVKLQHFDVVSPENIENAFQTASKERVNAIIVLPSALTFLHRKRVVELAARHRLPAMYPFEEYIQDGGLITYAPSFTDLYRRAASYVDKILKGARPADLPVEQPRKIDLIINLKTAKAMGITIPPEVLLRATKVIN